jgi:hypothetical protein
MTSTWASSTVPRRRCRRWPWVSSSSTSSIRRQRDPFVHGRAGKDRSGVRGKDRVSRSASVLGVGVDLRPVRAPVGRDDGESPEPPNLGLTDLPPLQPWWGRRRDARPPIRCRRQFGVCGPPVKDRRCWYGVAAGCTTLRLTRRLLEIVGVWSPTVWCRAVRRPRRV